MGATVQPGFFASLRMTMTVRFLPSAFSVLGKNQRRSWLGRFLYIPHAEFKENVLEGALLIGREIASSLLFQHPEFIYEVFRPI